MRDLVRVVLLLILPALPASVAVGGESHDAQPPWPPLYKIHPDEQQRLTAADVVGPDGIVYPNWTHCAVQGGIPAIKDAVGIEDFGGRADDDKDDSAALDRDCAAVGGFNRWTPFLNLGQNWNHPKSKMEQGHAGARRLEIHFVAAGVPALPKCSAAVVRIWIAIHRCLYALLPHVVHLSFAFLSGECARSQNPRFPQRRR
ncbi:MAG TPA: hypothetical protein VGP72_05330 [Planctomycetota bacterium]|jgi:hypothetical protein